MIVQYLCSECGKQFSFVEAIHEPRERRREASCPFCSCRTLVLLGREVFNERKRKKAGLDERIFLDMEEDSCNV